MTRHWRLALAVAAATAACRTPPPRPVAYASPPLVVPPVAPLTSFVPPPAPPPPPPPPPADLIVLAPHPEGGDLGSVVVRAGGADVDLRAPGQAVDIRPGEPPPPPTVLAAAEIARVFGDALGAMPPSARRFELTYPIGSNRWTREAESRLAELLAVVAERGAPDVVIVGHTDRAGAAAANLRLGLRRATLVRDRLLAAGLQADRIELSSAGETQPLEPTPDHRRNARNRRVEVTVR